MGGENPLNICTREGLVSCCRVVTLMLDELLGARVVRIGRRRVVRHLAWATAVLGLVLAPAAAAQQPAEADLVITASDGDVVIEPGDVLTYTIVVGNNGPGPAEGVKVLNALAGGTSYQGADASAGTCSETGGIVMCDIGGLESGAAARVLLSVLVDELADTTITNSFVASSTSSDPDLSNNTATETTSTVEVLPSTGVVDDVLLPLAAVAIVSGIYLVVWARRSSAIHLVRRVDA